MFSLQSFCSKRYSGTQTRLVPEDILKIFIFSMIFTLSLSECLQAQNLGEIFAGPKEGFWNTQWERLKVQASLKALNGDIGGVVNAQAKYDYIVQPAFIQGLHQRQDAWIGQISTDTSRLTSADGSPFGASGTMGAQVIFSRVFKTKAEAVKADIYWLDRIPWKAENVERSLHEGDAVRLETFLDLSASVGHNELLNGAWSLGASISETRGIRFLADLYRMKNNRIRVRLIGQRNDGTESLGISVNPLHSIDFLGGLVSKSLNRWFGCPILGVTFTNAELQDPPVDTQMTDFIFNLNTPDGRRTYNQVMENILNLKYLDVLNPQLLFEGRGRASTYIDEELEHLVAQAEKIYSEDKQIFAESRRVDRLFKGKSRSALSNQELKSKCLQIWELRALASDSKTYVENYDQNDVLSHEVFESSYVTAKKSSAFSLIEVIKRSYIDALFNASSDYTPTAMSDLVITTERHEKAFHENEYRDLKEHLAYILPNKTFSQIDWSNFEDTTDTKNNVSLKYDLIFHQEALDALPQLSPSEVYTQLYNYIQKYPGRDNLSVEQNPLPWSGGYSSDPMDKFEYAIEELMIPMAHLLNHKQSASERMKSFAAVRTNPLFRQIGPGFLISLLPGEQADRLLAFKIYITAANNQSVAFNNNQKGLSPTFAAVQYILGLINDRSFDLRLQLDESGNIRPTGFSPNFSQVPKLTP
jgi:hypothetical protein